MESGQEPGFQFSYSYLKPVYDSCAIKVTGDSLKYPLDSLTYSAIKSFNVFESGSEEYIAFYDERSQSVNIYNLKEQRIKKRILLKDILGYRRLYKTTVFVKNLDSIFISNYRTLYVANRDNHLVDSINYLSSPQYAWAFFQNTTPPFFENNVIYASVRPYMDESSAGSLKKWKALYELNMQNRKAILHFNLPSFLQTSYYGHRFLEHSVCQNKDKRIIFSFAADSLIYEVDLSGAGKAFLAKSRYQTTPISPVDRKDLKEDRGYYNFMIRDSYGGIYYDVHRGRYLRVANSGLPVADATRAGEKKPHSLIILDSSFRIIGESRFDSGVSLSSLFITHDGEAYARVDIQNENVLSFVKLSYSELR